LGYFLQLIDGLKGFLSHTAQSLIDRLCIHRLKTAFDSLLGAIHFELLEVRDGDG
jgi:hypothetical protein